MFGVKILVITGKNKNKKKTIETYFGSHWYYLKYLSALQFINKPLKKQII